MKKIILILAAFIFPPSMYPSVYYSMWGVDANVTSCIVTIEKITETTKHTLKWEYYNGDYGWVWEEEWGMDYETFSVTLAYDGGASSCSYADSSGRETFPAAIVETRITYALLGVEYVYENPPPPPPPVNEIEQDGRPEGRGMFTVCNVFPSAARDAAGRIKTYIDIEINDIVDMDGVESIYIEMVNNQGNLTGSPVLIPFNAANSEWGDVYGDWTQYVFAFYPDWPISNSVMRIRVYVKYHGQDYFVYTFGDYYQHK